MHLLSPKGILLSLVLLFGTRVEEEESSSAPENPIPVLTSLDDIRALQAPAIVKFAISSCRYCVQLAPEYQSLHDSYISPPPSSSTSTSTASEEGEKGQEAAVDAAGAPETTGDSPVYEVSCDQDASGEFCASQGIGGFPTIRFYAPSEAEGEDGLDWCDYAQERKADAIKAGFERFVAFKLRTFASEDAAQAAVDAFLASEGKESAPPKEYAVARVSGAEGLAFLQRVYRCRTDADSLFVVDGAGGQNELLFHSAEGLARFDLLDAPGAERLDEFLKYHSQAVFTQFNFFTAHSIFSLNFPILIVRHGAPRKEEGEESAPRDELMEAMRAAMLENKLDPSKKKLVGLTMDPEDPQMKMIFDQVGFGSAGGGVDEEGGGEAIIFGYDEELKKPVRHKMANRLTEENFRQFLSDFSADKLLEFLMSEDETVESSGGKLGRLAGKDLDRYVSFRDAEQKEVAAIVVAVDGTKEESDKVAQKAIAAVEEVMVTDAEQEVSKLKCIKFDTSKNEHELVKRGTTQVLVWIKGKEGVVEYKEHYEKGGSGLVELLKEHGVEMFYVEKEEGEGQGEQEEGGVEL